MSVPPYLLGQISQVSLESIINPVIASEAKQSFGEETDSSRPSS